MGDQSWVQKDTQQEQRGWQGKFSDWCPCTSPDKGDACAWLGRWGVFILPLVAALGSAVIGTPGTISATIRCGNSVCMRVEAPRTISRPLSGTASPACGRSLH